MGNPVAGKASFNEQTGQLLHSPQAEVRVRGRGRFPRQAALELERDHGIVLGRGHFCAAGVFFSPENFSPMNFSNFSTFEKISALRSQMGEATEKWLWLEESQICYGKRSTRIFFPHFSAFVIIGWKFCQRRELLPRALWIVRAFGPKNIIYIRRGSFAGIVVLSDQFRRKRSHWVTTKNIRPDRVDPRSWFFRSEERKNGCVLICRPNSLYD